MKKLITLLLALLMIASSFAFVACNNEPKDPVDPGQPTNNPSNPATPGEDTQVGDGIDYIQQVSKENFNNAWITILCREDKDYEMYTEEDSAALVDQAVFARNNRVSAEFGVQIEIHPVAGTWETKETFIQTLSQSVAAGDDAYQLAATHTAYNANISLNEQYYDLRSLGNAINLDAPWWSASFNENCTVYDKLFITAGDLALTLWEGMYAVFFNRKLATDYCLENLYQMVRDKEWTLEALTEITAGLYQDDGNDQLGPEDIYGLLINRHAMRVFLTTCQLPICERTTDGGYELVLMDEDHIDKTTSVYDSIYALIYEKDGTYDSQLQDGDYTEMAEIFTGGRSLFMMGTLDNSPKLRAADMEFGILPFPKYDDEQEEYYAHTYDGLSSFGIPLSAKDPAMCAKILDAMAAENKTSVIPAYNEIVLDGRVAQDGDSREMLNIIRENLFFDFGFAYSNSMTMSGVSGPFALFGDALRRQSASFSTEWDQYATALAANLEDVMSKFDK